jgi:hypothetical protein
MSKMKTYASAAIISALLVAVTLTINGCSQNSPSSHYAEDHQDLNANGIKTAVAPFGGSPQSSSTSDPLSKYSAETGTTADIYFCGNGQFVWDGHDLQNTRFGTWTLNGDHVNVHLPRGPKSTQYTSVAMDFSLAISQSGNVACSDNGQNGWRRMLPSASQRTLQNSNGSQPDPYAALHSDPAFH